MGHLDSQRSLPVFAAEKAGLSALDEITSVTGYKPVAFVAVDEQWTALRSKKV